MCAQCWSDTKPCMKDKERKCHICLRSSPSCTFFDMKGVLM